MTAPTKESAFLRACRRQPVPHTPVWFMRQAGRSLPEYRAARKKRKSMLAACMMPDLVTEITLQPVRRYHVDAAILFSDIVVPLRAVGVDVDIKPGIGPVIGRPVRREADLARLRVLEPSDVSYLVPAISSLVAELGSTPLIGFAGGPFTLASYLVEGGPSKNQERTKALMYGDPPLWHALLTRLTDITIAFLQVQVSAGASAVQLFDSWVGTLSPEDYRAAVLPHSKRIFETLAGAGVPRLHFGVGTGELLGLMSEAGADVVGVDWRPGRAAGALGRGQAAGQGRAVPRPRRGRAHLQPRARGAARDRPGYPGPPGRLRARGVGAQLGRVLPVSSLLRVHRRASRGVGRTVRPTGRPLAAAEAGRTRLAQPAGRGPARRRASQRRPRRPA